MKKSYVLFITLVLVVVFSVLANFILETSSLKNEAFKQKYLYLQAKNHILFLEDYILKTELEDTKDIKIDDDLFKTSKRNMMYSSDEQGNFSGATPKQLAAAIGKELPGARVVTKKVTEYTIGENRVNQYTTIVLPKENVETVFKNAGHPIQTEEFVDESTGEVIYTYSGAGVGA